MHITLKTFPDMEEVTKRTAVLPSEEGGQPVTPPPHVPIPWDVLEQQEVISLDTETDTKAGTDPDPHRDPLCGLSLGWKEGQIYIPVEDVPADFARLLDGCGNHLVGHNAKYDTIVLARAGHPVRFTDDTMLMAYTHGGRLPAGLKPLTRQLLQREAQELGPLQRKYKRTGAIPFELIAPYAEADARNTWDCYQAMRPDTDPLYDKLEMPMMHLLTEMELKGWHVDKEALNELDARIQGDLDSTREGLERLFGLKRPTAGGDVADILEAAGIVLPATDTGRRSVDKDLLKSIDHPMAVPLLHFRYWHKRQSTWLKAMREGQDEEGYIHATFNQSPRSGRLSCSAPNLQNYPPVVRCCLGPDPGHHLLAADWSQYELRILARASDDPTLVAEFVEGIDIHARNQADLELPSRTVAKNTIYGISYGQGPKDLAEKIERSIGESQQFIKSIFRKYKRLRPWMRELLAECRRTGYSETLMGRKRYLPEAQLPDWDARGHAERAAVNHVIQGTAADLMKLGQIYLTPLLKEHGARVVAQIHDEWVISTPNPFATYEALMTTVDYLAPWLEPVPSVLEVRVGRHWGETK